MTNTIKDTSINLLPIEVFAFFASLFLIPPQSEHFYEFRQYGIHHTYLFISYVQRYDPQRSSRFFMDVSNIVVWQMRAGQVVNGLVQKYPDIKFKDTTGFPLHRATGWIGNSDKSNGFYFREWCCTICVYTRRHAGIATGLVLCWVDDKPYYLPESKDWGNTHIDECGNDGATYVFFIRKILWASEIWHRLWVETLDEIDLLINVQVSKIFKTLKFLQLSSWLADYF